MPRLHVLGLSLCLCAIPVVAQAQSRGLFGGQPTGFGGQQPTGFGGQMSGTGGSTSGFNNGGSMFGNSGGGMFSNSAGTGTASGQGGGIQRDLNLGGAYTLPVGENPFVGVAPPAGGFVGDRRAGMGAFGSSSGYGGSRFGGSGFSRGGRGSFGGGGGRGGWGGGRGDWSRWDWGGDDDEGATSIRPRVEIGFETSRVSTVTQSAFVERFDRITAREPGLANVTYEADGAGRVVLRGTVPNEEAAGLAAALFRLEPGVNEVINETTIAGAEAQ